MSMEEPRIWLSPPHMSGRERELVNDAFDSNWIAPLGPHVDAFEREFAAAVQTPHAAALSSGSAALHLALRTLGVKHGDEVVVPSLTFAASAFAVTYQGARPVFIDSERRSWNMDPDLLAEWLEGRARRGKLPAAVMVVHLYGQTADLDPILATCARFGIPVIEDAAEALGAEYHGRPPGGFGAAGVFSFNGNKVITTSGGGMLVSPDEALVARVRKLSTQAREPEPHYEHTEIGFNYRLSNVLAAIGRAQMAVLGERVEARRRNFSVYSEALGDLPGVEFMPEASWGKHSRWLTCLTLRTDEFGATPTELRLALDAENIEARPVWKPLHEQPVFAECECVGGGTVASDLFARGICLPSGSSLTDADLERVVGCIQRFAPSVART